MDPQKVIKKHFFFILVVVFLFVVQNLFSQRVVGLDNWFNHETDTKTGKPFHYLWTDTDFSGYSRW
jgi:hypothetical protein